MVLLNQDPNSSHWSLVDLFMEPNFNEVWPKSFLGNPYVYKPTQMINTELIYNTDLTVESY